MMKKRALSISLVLALCLGFVAIAGCGVPPQDEFDRAKSAIEDARRLGGEHYAGSEMIHAEKALDEGRTHMFLLRFDKAKSEFGKAYEKAIDAANKAMAANSVATSVRTPGVFDAGDFTAAGSGANGCCCGKSNNKCCGRGCDKCCPKDNCCGKTGGKCCCTDKCKNCCKYRCNPYRD